MDGPRELVVAQSPLYSVSAKPKTRKHRTSKNKIQNQSANLQFLGIERVEDGAIELIVVEIAPQISKTPHKDLQADETR